MFEYKCDFCGAILKTQGSQSSRKEICPSCGKVNILSFSEDNLAEKQRNQKKKPLEQQKNEEREKQILAEKELATENERQRKAAQIAEEQAAENKRQKLEMEKRLGVPYGSLG